MGYLLHSALRNLKRKRSRTALTILGIMIGVASVTLISSIGQYGASAVGNELESLGLSGLTISAATGSQSMLKEDELSVIETCSGVEAVTPVLVETAELSSKRYETQALVWGIDTNADEIISLEVIYGRMFDRSDIKGRESVCLVDEAFANQAYARSNIIGKTVSVLYGGAEREFEVIGIVKTGSGLLQNMMGNYIPTFVYLPYTTFQQSTGKTGFDQIAVKVQNSDEVSETGQGILANLERFSGQVGGYLANDIAKQRETLDSMLGIVTLVLSAVGAVSLLVASLSIMTVMLVSVSERTREIGVKKSLGATRGTILLEFMFEALFLSLFGCLCGLAVGFALSFAGASILHTTFAVRGDVVLLSLIFSMLSGVIFGVYPAAQAARLNPVDALRQNG